MRARQNSGFTLLEICVAIAIFAIGILTSLSVLVPAVRWGAEAKNDFTAAEAALSAAEFLQAGGKLNDKGLYLGSKKNDEGNTTLDFYPFVVHVTSNSNPSNPLTPLTQLPTHTPTSATLRVYRRLLKPDTEKGAGGAYERDISIDESDVVKIVANPYDEPGLNNLHPLFKITMELYRP